MARDVFRLLEAAEVECLPTPRQSLSSMANATDNYK
ncbi:hypothetical protein L914_08672 [Phytophthora nicotianae]|uniref:Uncharacterized protein n=1 Tax=Phytophthora nicotianae TaxID=4792 RepID=W2NET0_PHYNI|nr:hypothetical protein L914_08672 [Phytophthora nicotianae]